MYEQNIRADGGCQLPLHEAAANATDVLSYLVRQSLRWQAPLSPDRWQRMAALLDLNLEAIVAQDHDVALAIEARRNQELVQPVTGHEVAPHEDTSAAGDWFLYCGPQWAEVR
jgi:hypothetical protein